MRIFAILLSVLLIFNACEVNKASKKKEGENPVSSITPTPILPGVLDSLDKDPCYWCFDDVFYSDYQNEIDCNIPCPCSAINIIDPNQKNIMEHRDNGAILDLGKIAANSGSPNDGWNCTKVEGDSILNFSLIYFLEDNCDTLDCANNIPNPSTITTILKYNGIDTIDSVLQKIHTIQSCDFKLNRCSPDSTCIASFFVNYSFKVFDYNARCTDDYELKFIIDHEDHLSRGGQVAKQLQPINSYNEHSHLDSLSIPICNNCGGAINPDQNK